MSKRPDDLALVLKGLKGKGKSGSMAMQILSEASTTSFDAAERSIKLVGQMKMISVMSEQLKVMTPEAARDYMLAQQGMELAGNVIMSLITSQQEISKMKHQFSLQIAEITSVLVEKGQEARERNEQRIIELQASIGGIDGRLLTFWKDLLDTARSQSQQDQMVGQMSVIIAALAKEIRKSVDTAVNALKDIQVSADTKETKMAEALVRQSEIFHDSMTSKVDNVGKIIDTLCNGVTAVITHKLEAANQPQSTATSTLVAQ